MQGKKKIAKIALEDGRVFTGRSFGSDGEKAGEVVFNTALTGYQEILTDPSYKGQIVTMTYPLIGNYGVNSYDVESRQIFAEGFIVKEASRVASNWRCEKTISQYLKENGIIGVEAVDTRAITRHIRVKGSMKAVISTLDLDDKRLVKKAKASKGLDGRDLVSEVTLGKSYSYGKGGKYKVVAIDCGIKTNILRRLNEYGCDVVVMPYDVTPDEILARKPDGLFLSNGPGDPAGVAHVPSTVKQLLGKLPIFGICLGHQMLSLALGGKTFKLKFGHHGGNHPVQDLKTKCVAITSQNHNFCVDIKSLKHTDVEMTHVNLNDNTPEGMKSEKLKFFSVQYHPEDGPGPHDANYLFKEFTDLMEKR
jgi:carbamoyl-phosphate synthase small subunit